MWILLERERDKYGRWTNSWTIIGTTFHEELANEFTENDELPHRKVVSSDD